MAVSKGKILEVISHSLEYGKKATLEAFNLSEETFNRYSREYKKQFGSSAELFSQLKERFTETELKSLLSGSKQKNPSIKTNIDFNGEKVKFLVLSDTHFGSIYTDSKHFDLAIEEANKENCDFMIHAGDVTEGIMNRPNHVFECSAYGYKAQKDVAIENLKKWNKPSYILQGNHDDSLNTKLGVGVNIVEEICNEVPQAKFIGNSTGSFTLNDSIVFDIFHGNDSASGYAISYRLQGIANGYSGGHKPHVLITGHDHKSMYLFYRNIHILAGGCIQQQSEWMQSKKIPAMVGFWIVEATLNYETSEVKKFTPTWYPLYV
jgi:predicted phosphodiesterase